MKTHTTSRRSFLITGTALAACSALKGEVPLNPTASRATANEFLSKWIEAWNRHDAHQLGLLQTSDANTVNRFGTLVEGRNAVEKALGFLHNPGGPYHDVTAPPLHLLGVRQIAPTVIILQASWKSPVMNGCFDAFDSISVVDLYQIKQQGKNRRTGDRFLRKAVGLRHNTQTQTI